MITESKYISRVYDLKRILSRHNLGKNIDKLYIQIYDDKLEIFHIDNLLPIYSTVTDSYFSQFEQYENKILYLVVDPEDLKTAIKIMSDKKVFISVQREPGESYAGNIVVSDTRFDYTIDNKFKPNKILEKKAKKIAVDHSICPRVITGMCDPNRIANKLYNILLNHTQEENRLGYMPSSDGIVGDNNMDKYPLTETRRVTPAVIRSWLPEDYNYPYDKISKLRDSFTSKGKWEAVRAGSTSPITIHTTIEELRKIIDITEHICPNDWGAYPLIINDGVVELEMCDRNGNKLEGNIKAGKVNGPDCKNIYTSALKTVAETVSGSVELQTAPNRNLAIIKRTRGNISRYIVPQRKNPSDAMVNNYII